ncbi:MAG: hypothetical protein ACE5ES_02910 [Candidatus Nanoarchaeia archaeon]
MEKRVVHVHRKSSENVKTKRRLAKIFKALPILLVILIFVLMIYASANNIGGIRYTETIPIATIIILYFAGLVMEKKYA